MWRSEMHCRVGYLAPCVHELCRWNSGHQAVCQMPVPAGPVPTSTCFVVTGFGGEVSQGLVSLRDPPASVCEVTGTDTTKPRFLHVHRHWGSRILLTSKHFII